MINATEYLAMAAEHHRLAGIAADPHQAVARSVADGLCAPFAGPLSELVETMSAAERGDYSRRARVTSDDEIGHRVFPVGGDDTPVLPVERYVRRSMPSPAARRASRGEGPRIGERRRRGAHGPGKQLRRHAVAARQLHLHHCEQRILLPAAFCKKDRYRTAFRYVTEKIPSKA